MNHLLSVPTSNSFLTLIHSLGNSLFRLLTMIFILLVVSVKPVWPQITSTPKDTSYLRFEKISERSTFIRMEEDAVLLFRMTNLTSETLNEVVVSIAFDWDELIHKAEFADSAKLVNFNKLMTGESREIPVRINTSIRPDDYKIVIKYSKTGTGSLIKAGEYPVKIIARELPDEYPVIMWGGGLPNMQAIRKVGFTHALHGINADYEKIWNAGKPVRPESEEKIHQTRLQLDKALAIGIKYCSYMAPGTYLASNEKYLRVDREGNLNKGAGVCGLLPGVSDFCYNVGASITGAYGDMPAFGATLLHSEVRDRAQPCFHEQDYASFRKATGLNIPKEIKGKTVDYKKINDFPMDRVIADNDPIYNYYLWYWREGDGWNGLNTELNRGLKTINRPDLWTWFDPAVRVASVYGSGAGADVISHWTYTYPDPVKIALAGDELHAMAGGSKHKQDVMNMTQIIWYRSGTAPEPEEGKKGPEFIADWEIGMPSGRTFPTIAPMHLREAFWLMIARPIKGIMYHGWQSLVKDQFSDSYLYTNPETQYELEHLIKEVIKPLGPTLKTVPGVKSDIAFYESFAAQVYANKGTHGWGAGWLGDSYQAMMWAGLQPDIIYDETIVEQGLDRFKILVMMDCDVITSSVAAKVKAFQKNGGMIIADTNLTPALKADITIDTYKRTGIAISDKAELLKRADQISKALNNVKYIKYLGSSNSQVITYRRRFAETDYIFLVNDNREYGKYMGHHGLVMENGLPSESRITVNRKSGFAYDLITHQPVQFRKENGRLVTDVMMGPCDGRLIMVTSRAIDHLTVNIPDKAVRGDQKNIDIEVRDIQEKTIDAIIPVEVQIRDSEGRILEKSGYWAAINGKLNIVIDIAPNDYEGIWQIRVKELASGKSVDAYFRVGKEPDGKFGPVDKNAGNAIQPKG